MCSSPSARRCQSPSPCGTVRTATATAARWSATGTNLCLNREPPRNRHPKPLISYSTMTTDSLSRRDFIQRSGLAGAGLAAAQMLPLRFLQAQTTGAAANPLAVYPNRDWEKLYRDQYAYDHAFSWVCAPNDTHNCRITAHVRNGVIVRLGEEFDVASYSDLYGNRATSSWGNRHCAKGYTFHRILYGPYRLKHPIVRKGWKRWADAGFPELTRELKALYKFDTRGTDKFERITWEQTFDYIARGTVAIAKRYSGDTGAKLLQKQGYVPEMIQEMGGAGTRTIKMRGGMGLLGVMGKYGMYRLCNSLALLDVHVRGVKPAEARAGRIWSNYTWHGDQAPGHPWVHGLQNSECDFNDLRFSKLIIMNGKNLVENKMADAHWFIECM
ncbi:MAG: molybdopterin-dependent oxidoreductase, partial [Dechloromonas sp.]